MSTVTIGNYYYSPENTSYPFNEYRSSGIYLSRGQRILCTHAGELNFIETYAALNIGSRFRMAVYSDNNGSPGSLIAQTNNYSSSPHGITWMIGNFATKPVLNANTYYWFFVAYTDTTQTSGNVNMRYISSPGTNTTFNLYIGSPPNFPSTASGNMLDGQLAIWGDLTPYTIIDAQEAGAAQETLTIGTNASEAGAGNEAATLTAAIPKTDVGQAVEASTIKLLISELCSGLETKNINASIPLSEAGDATENGIIGLNISGTEAGTGIDSVPNITLRINESGAGTELFSITATFTLTDSAHGAENTALTLRLSDTGSGAEIILISTPVFFTDSGVGSDSTATQATVNISELCSGLEALGLIAAVNKAESASATDTFNLKLGFSDSGSGLEAFRLILNCLESATGVDSKTVTVAIAKTESAHAVDVVNMQALIGLIESALVVDRTEILALISEYEDGSAADEAILSILRLLLKIRTVQKHTSVKASILTMHTKTAITHPATTAAFNRTHVTARIKTPKVVGERIEQ